MARRLTSSGGMGPAWIGAASVVLAALIGAAAIVWQSSRTPGERSASTSTAPAAAPAITDCAQPRGSASEVRVAPNAARPGDRVVISGSGYPDSAKVWLNLDGHEPNFDIDMGHIGTPALDGCGRFELEWVVPPTVGQSGYTRFRINATGQDAGGNDIVTNSANEANAEFTLLR